MVGTRRARGTSQPHTAPSSPSQIERLERLEARYPATVFAVVEQDPYSRALSAEASDAHGDQSFVLSANGKAVPS